MDDSIRQHPNTKGFPEVVGITTTEGGHTYSIKTGEVTLEVDVSEGALPFEWLDTNGSVSTEPNLGLTALMEGVLTIGMMPLAFAIVVRDIGRQFRDCLHRAFRVRPNPLSPF